MTVTTKTLWIHCSFFTYTCFSVYMFFIIITRCTGIISYTTTCFTTMMTFSCGTTGSVLNISFICYTFSCYKSSVFLTHSTISSSWAFGFFTTSISIFTFFINSTIKWTIVTFTESWLCISFTGLFSSSANTF